MNLLLSYFITPVLIVYETEKLKLVETFCSLAHYRYTASREIITWDGDNIFFFPIP